MLENNNIIKIGVNSKIRLYSTVINENTTYKHNTKKG
jgi:hypothetical protein